jgi:hypothetical protein
VGSGGGGIAVKRIIIINNAASMPTYLWDDKQRPEHLGDGPNGVIDLLHGGPEPPPRLVVLRGRLVAIGWHGNDLGLWLSLPIAIIEMRPTKPFARDHMLWVGDTPTVGYRNAGGGVTTKRWRGCFGAQFAFASVRLGS